MADQAGSYISESVGCFFPDPPLGIFRALLGQSSQAAGGIFTLGSLSPTLEPSSSADGALPLDLQDMPREDCQPDSFLWPAEVLEAQLPGRPDWVWAKTLSTKEGAYVYSIP